MIFTQLGTSHQSKPWQLDEVFCESHEIGMLRYKGASIPVEASVHGWYNRDLQCGGVICHTGFSETVPEGMTSQQYAQQIESTWRTVFTADLRVARTALVAPDSGRFVREAARIATEWYARIEGVLNRVVEDLSTLKVEEPATLCNAQPDEKENF